MIILNIVASLACGALNALGGYHWLFCRRFIMPFVIGVCAAITTHTWWVLFLPLPAMGTLCIGYADWRNVGRGLWLALQATVLGLGLLITGHLMWYLFAPYVLGALVLGTLYVNWKQILGDAVTGTYLGAVLLLLR